MTTLSPFRRNALFFLAAIPALYLISRPGSETPEVQDPSQLRLPSPDGKWLAILRQNSLAVSPYPAIPIDQLFIEPRATRKIIVQPVFVAKWKYRQQYKIEWASANELRVEYPADAEILNSESASGEVKLIYVPQSGAPKSGSSRNSV